MRLTLRSFAVPLALLAVPSLAAQQPSRGIVFQALGGGATHLRNLNTTGGVAHFQPGFNLGGAVGVQANEYFGLHLDFTYTRNQARGASAFSGANVDRYFYGAHAELSYPAGSRVAPFAFAGGGAVTVTQTGPGTALPDFTKPAAMFGAGLRYQLGNAPFEVLLEGKSLVYQWDRGGFSRTLWDVSYSAGFAYRLGL